MDKRRAIHKCMHPDWTGEDMEGVIANRVFFSLALLYFIPPVHFQNVIYREGASFDSRKFVSLGGLFNFRRSKDGQCDALRAPTAERAEAMVFAIHKINSDRSLLPGVNLTFDIRDTCYVSNIALERSLDFVQSSEASCTNQTMLAVSGVVGSSRSSVSHWKKSRISLRQIAIQYRAKFPVHFPAPVLEKLRTGIGQVQKSVQEITPYTFEGNVVSFRKCSGF